MVLGKDSSRITVAGKEKCFEELETAAELEEFMCEVSYKHDIYFHYTKAQSFRAIHEGKTINLGSPISSNDKKESDFVKKMMDDSSCKQIPFLLSFSSPIDKSDNISMWYLYTKGQGIALKMSVKEIKKLVESDQLSLIDIDTKKILKKLNKQDIEIKIRDVVYYHYGNEKMELRWHGHSNYKMAKSELEEYMKMNSANNIFFCKDMVWNAEEEVRVIGYVDHNLIERFKGIKCAVSISLEKGFFNSCSVIKGPEFDDDIVYIQKAFPDMTVSSAVGNVNVPFWK